VRRAVHGIQHINHPSLGGWRANPRICSGKATSRANLLSRKSTFDDILYLLCGEAARRPVCSGTVRELCEHPTR
jgi:hypothetical protein